MPQSKQGALIVVMLLAFTGHFVHIHESTSVLHTGRREEGESRQLNAPSRARSS